MEEQKPLQSNERFDRDTNHRLVEKKNTIGFVGFILALLGMLFCWVPGLSFLLWFLGLIFSIIGVRRTSRGFAIVGIVITCVSSVYVFVVTITGLIVGLAIYTEDIENRMVKTTIEYVEIRGKKGSVEVYIGMPKDSVRMLVGKPDGVDMRNTFGTTYEDWGYKINNRYSSDLDIHFEDGRLQSVQQREY